MIFIASFAMLLHACQKEKKGIKTEVRLAGKDSAAMEASVFKWLARKSFTTGPMADNKRSFDKWYQTFSLEADDNRNNVYFLLTRNLYAYDDEVAAMAEFVENGNTLFVAANGLSGNFLDQFSLMFHDPDPYINYGPPTTMKDTYKRLEDTALFPSRHFSFFFYPQWRTLMADTAGGLTHEVLGRNQNNVPDFLRIQYGKGQLLVMTNCEGLGNYFLLTRDNNRYALGALSYLPTSPAQVYWDDFYFSHTVRPPEESRNSILHVIFSIPYLFWAFWILILLLALWVITNFFRKQRLLPVRKPNTNSSMEFTKTIARLYFNKKDNRNIALKMIAYFQDHLRGKYYMNFTGFNEEFGRILAAKTGLDPARAEQLVNTIQTVQHNATTTDETLLALNEQIQEVLRK